MSRSSGHIQALTALRFFAALLVVLFHHGQAQFTSAPIWLQNVIKGGYVGVPFFFILSGFILAYNYAAQAEAQTLDNRRFWVARFARIYPVYAASLLLSAPMFMAAIMSTGKADGVLGQIGLHAVASFALAQSWIPAWAFVWNGPAWSLSVEAFFYLSFPFIMKTLTRRQRGRILAGIVVVGVSFVAVGKLIPSMNALVAAQRLLGWANPLLWLPLFLAGIWAGEQYLQQEQTSRWRQWVSVRSSAMGLGVVMLIVVLMAANLQRFSQLLYCYLLAPLCALLISLLAGKGSWFGRIISRPMLVLLGEASYSLYILHRPIHDWFSWMERHWSLPSTNSTLGFLLYLAVCLAFSVLTLKAIEYPCRDWIKRQFGSRPVGAGGVQSLPKPAM
jgi:peptidoglycan/LPS O-acetylase OafA/YrhL